MGGVSFHASVCVSCRDGCASRVWTRSVRSSYLTHTNTHPRVHMVGRDQSDVRGWTRARWFSRRATVKYITSKLQQIIICHIPENWMKCKLFWIVNAVGKQCHTSEMSCGKSLYHSMNCCMQREYKPVITFPPDLQWLSTSALIYIRELLAN